MSQRSTRPSWRQGCIALVPLIHAAWWGLLAGQAAAEESAINQIDAAIRHAKTYDLLSATEHGDLPASQAGLRELECAEEVLRHARLPSDESDRIGKRIAAVKGDLEGQIKRASGTLEGEFPLNRFLTSPLFADSGPTAVYRLIGDPAIKATGDAAANLAAQVDELGKKSGRLPVIFIAVPPGQTRRDDSQAGALEHAARQAFHGSPRFSLPRNAAVTEALTPGKGETDTPLEDFRAGRITPAVEEKLLKAFGPNLLVVAIRRADVIADDVYYYQTEGNIIEASKPQETFSTFGLGRDRHDRLAWIVWANAALLAAAFGAYALIVFTHRAMAVDRSWTTLLALPLVAFVVGHALPYAVSPLLGSIRLPPETPALVSFWIPCLAGLSFLVAPLAAYWLASSRFAELWPSLSPGNRGGALFAAMGAGVAAYLAGPMLLYSEQHPALDVMLMSVSAMVLAYLLGRTLDYSDPLPTSFVFVPLILAMPAGAALLHADTIGLGFAAGSIAVAATAIVAVNATRRNRRLKTARSNFNPSLADQARIGGGIPADVQELVLRAENPDYQQFPSFDRAWDRMSGLIEGHCCHLGLFGRRGAGKTATVRAITKRLVQELEKGGSRPALLCGSCPQPISEPISYAPFREALAQHFEVDLLAPPGPKMQQISQALGGLFGSVMPFARILFPHTAGADDAAVRPDEINASIVWMLRRLSKARPILLFLDDVQWLDEASATLVKYLIEAFPAGSNTPVAVVLVADRKSCLADIGFDVARNGIELAYPSLAEQAQILVRGVGLQPGVAEEILLRTGAARETDGGLLWPLQVVAKLARSGALRAQRGRIRLGQRRLAGGLRHSGSHASGDPGAVGRRGTISCGLGMCGVRM